MDRKERFKQLRRRANQSAQENRKELYNESNRAREGEKSLTAQKAEIELAKIEAEEAGEDFERKRAWDWTVEESEKWDAKQKEKKSSYADDTDQAERTYYKQMRDIDPSTSNSKESKEQEEEESYKCDHKPAKKNVDKLVSALNKTQQNSLKRRKTDESSISYINQKNKDFNEKLSRHYDKYNKNVRDALERGSA
ncbi:pre-mRNA-splicing factor Syf2p [Trichomonascus vanleenenianus]|uniref:Syf2p n=1 Tax=Trichomonascus vanleenenianus TaxID=2268995 RepID=UPI003ECBA5BB